MRQIKIWEWPALARSTAVAEWEGLRKQRDAGGDSSLERKAMRADMKVQVVEAKEGAYTVGRLVEDYITGYVVNHRIPANAKADQRFRPEDRHNESTSEAARFLGQMGLPDPTQLVKGEYTGLSPKQIDHLLCGYFSWIATAATTASNSIFRNNVVDRGESPDLRLKDVFLEGNFMETLPTGGCRYVSAMYEQSRAVEQAYASYRDALASGDQEGAAAILESDGGKIRSRASVATATKLLAQLNA